jgi:hypothetical protein
MNIVQIEQMSVLVKVIKTSILTYDQVEYRQVIPVDTSQLATMQYVRARYL